MNDKIIFFRIPKTAGTSITQLFINLMGNATVTTDINIDRKFLTGIWGWDSIDIENWIDNNFIFTFLRNPEERCLSWYYSEKGNKNINQKLLQCTDKKSLTYMDNAMTWQFGNYYPYPDRNIPVEECLTRAKENISKLDFVGFYDDLENDVKELMRLLELPDNAVLPKTNITQQKDYTNVPDEAMARLKTLTTYDRQLYEYAVKNFKHVGMGVKSVY